MNCAAFASSTWEALNEEKSSMPDGETPIIETPEEQPDSEGFAVAVTLNVPTAPEVIGAAIAKKMWNNARIRERVEARAAASIDHSIAAIVREKASSIVETTTSGLAPDGYFRPGDAFDFRKFVQSKVAEWLATGHLEKVIEDIIRQETDALAKEARSQIRGAIEAEAKKAVEAVEKAAVREASKAFEEALKQGLGAR